MSEAVKKHREERARIVNEMRALTDKAQTEKRDLTGEELAQHEKLFGQAENARKQIEAAERQLEVERQTAAAIGDEEARKRGNGAETAVSGKPTATEEYRSAFNAYIAGGRASLTADQVRALSGGVGNQGGFTIAPEQFVNQLIKFVDDNVVIRAKATKLRVPGAMSLGVPELTTDISDADWSNELSIGSEDNAMAFGKRKMQPTKLAKNIKISRDLLRYSGLGIEALTVQRLGYKFAITEEKAFLTGHGANQPLGLFTASVDGVTTGRDVSIGNTTTAIGFDGLINAVYGVKDQYRRNGEWLFHRDAIRQIATLKDTTNQYLWQPSNIVGQPDTILGRPVISSEYVPNTFTTGQYVGLFGDFSFYWIADGFDMEIQRLEELYAGTDQIGLIGRMSCDGAPVLAEAFARVRLA
ncbi:MAG: phage major capsid protein [Magnetospirillum sp.]|nr:phage major capsid protein [Magnetospirillum sp.]